MNMSRSTEPLKYPKSKQPAPNRMIRVRGFDWSDFTVEGMFVPFKPGSPKRLLGKSRFMRMDPTIGLIADRESWVDGESWEYIDGND